MIPSTIRVRLLREHIVNAQSFPPGRVITLPPDSATFVIAAGVAEALEPPSAPPPLPPEPVGQGTPNRNPKRS